MIAATDASGPAAEIRFFPPCAKLRPYLSTIYLLTTSASLDGRVTADLLHPEWANIRFFSGDRPIVAIGPGPRHAPPAAVMAGATSRATYFACGIMRAWGIGLLPAGWHKFVGGDADVFTDRLFDAQTEPACAGFAALAAILLESVAGDEEEMFAAIERLLLDRLDDGPDDDPIIWEAHAALVDDSVASVAEWGAGLGVSSRTLERLSRRAFGFSPKLLLRRQRFLRSLAQFMLDPSMQWTRTLDHRYCDQAQFTHDFTRFMGMTAREYAALDHPVLEAAARARLHSAGAAMQALHIPQRPDNLA